MRHPMLPKKRNVFVRLWRWLRAKLFGAEIVGWKFTMGEPCILNDSYLLNLRRPGNKLRANKTLGECRRRKK